MELTAFIILFVLGILTLLSENKDILRFIYLPSLILFMIIVRLNDFFFHCYESDILTYALEMKGDSLDSYYIREFIFWIGMRVIYFITNSDFATFILLDIFWIYLLFKTSSLKKYEKLNNEVLPKVAKDTQARIGCKGKDKFWYGYKESVSVDMQSGLINKVALTPANVTDAKALKHVCPQSGGIYADKAYCTKAAKQSAAKNNCHLAAIKKNNMKGKNKELDRWYSHLRSPYERVFSKRNKRVRYKGIEKNQFAAFIQSICFNLKRLVVLNPSNLQLS